MTFAGKAAHSSTPALGVNAIEIALQAMAINPKLNLAAISGGTAVNVVPARCDVVVATDAALDVPIGGATQTAEFRRADRGDHPARSDHHDDQIHRRAQALCR